MKPSCPSSEDTLLWALYERLNRECFAGGLATAGWTVRFASELNARGGDCDGQRRRIRVASYLLRYHGIEAVQDTLLHEMTHQWEMQRFGRSGHSARFWQKLRSLSGYRRVEKRAPANPERAVRHGRRTVLIYQCPRCHIEVRRARRGVWSCARCDHRFNPALVLRLVRTVAPDSESQPA